MKTSDLLKKTKTQIKKSISGCGSSFLDNRYICYTFESQCFEYIYGYEKRCQKISDFKKYVEKLLEGHSSLNYWLFNNKYISRDQMYESYIYGTKEFNKMQRTRLAWLDWMIKQHEAIGD